MDSDDPYAKFVAKLATLPEFSLEEKMLVEDLMTDFVLAVETDAKLGSAKKAMDDHHIRHLPVLEDGRVIGLLSKREFASAASIAARFNADRDTYEDFLDSPVREFLKTRFAAEADVVTIGPKDRIKDAIDVLVHCRLSALPVVDHQGDLVGIISYIDILAALRDALE